MDRDTQDIGRDFLFGGPFWFGLVKESFFWIVGDGGRSADYFFTFFLSF